MRKPWHISRRTVLRGAGASVALPMLEAMGPTTAQAARSVKRPPIRTAVLFYPNGVRPDTWEPKTAGGSYEITPALKPLEAFKRDMLVISGLRHKGARKGDGHYAKTANWLTGHSIVKTTGKDLNVGGVSMDQLAAKTVGIYTPLPSLELGIDPVTTGTDTNVGFTRVYGSHISWSSATTPVGKEIMPQLAFDRLFKTRRSRKATGGPERDDALFKPVAQDTPEESDDKSVLDAVQADAKALRGKIGKADQRKLDEYLEAVRTVERQIDAANRPQEKGAWKPKSLPKNLNAQPPAGPRDHQAHVRLMLDLMVLAYWTDITRVSTFMFGNSVSGKNFSFLDGVSGGHHQISHHQNDAGKLEMYKRINIWHCQQLAYMLDRMKNIDEGDGTLLDNSMVLFGSGLRDGNRHDGGNCPLILAGKGGGSLKPGRYLRYKDQPMADLLLAMLHRMGVKQDRFADSTGPLKGLR